MSDVPPPPPPGGTPLPPPPPPSLTAPPGAAPPGAAPMYAGALKRTNGVGRAAMILVGVAGGLALLTALTGRMMTDEAQRYLDGGVSDQTFVESIAAYALLSVLQLVGVLAAAVLVVIWMFRMAANHRALHRAGTWGPGWAIGGWVLPPLLYIIPSLMFNELWKAADPDVPAGGNWKAARGSPLVAVWFVTYSLLPIATLFGQNDVFSGFGAAEQDLAEQIIDNQDIALIGGLISAAGAAAFIAMARQLLARHQRFTGER